ncbi:MAG: carbonic anhydrase family protein [Methylococcaceae bacterium]|nr:MAG: carbonic anhydrase family protein [Methylococcaceae bacterium]
MNKTCAIVITMMGLAPISVAFSAPHWTHEEQAEWGAIEDTSQSAVPLMYPYAECTIGAHQSPVDLSNQSKAKTVNAPRFNYVRDATDFFNSGHAAQVNTSSDYKGGISIGADFYPLIQYHFHAPAEHVIGKTTYPGELHFVHIREDGRIAVVGVLLEEGDKPSRTVDLILRNTPTTQETHNTTSGITLNPASLLPKEWKNFYTYAGSLTTPPCSEGVSWYVLEKPLIVTPKQIHKLKSLYENNNRLPQNLNGRVVTGNH